MTVQVVEDMCSLSISTGSTLGLICGSTADVPSRYDEFAGELGERIGRAGTDLVFGGDGRGAMGVLVRAAISGGGRVTNVMPHRLLPGRTPVKGCPAYVVQDRTACHQLVNRLARGFVVLPGGLDAFDGLGAHAAATEDQVAPKPIVLANFDGYFEALVDQLDRALQDGFITRRQRQAIAAGRTVDEVLRLLGIL